MSLNPNTINQSTLAGLSNEGSSPSEKVVNIMTEIRALQEIIAKFKSLQVDATEYACLKGIVLFKTGKSFFSGYDLRRQTIT